VQQVNGQFIAGNDIYFLGIVDFLQVAPPRSLHLIIQMWQSRAPVASDLSSSLAYLARLPPLEIRAAPACTCARTHTHTHTHLYLPAHTHKLAPPTAYCVTEVQRSKIL
jgi:hypothetical protein